MVAKGDGWSRMKKYIDFYDKENGYIKAVFLRRFSKIVPYMSLDEKTREKVEKARLRYGQKT